VEYAITRLISNCVSPTVPANTAVVAPNIIIAHKPIALLFSQFDIRISKNTPAVTIVAAWINAETGVGPSIASGNQVCKPTCADFPTAAAKNNKQDTVTNAEQTLPFNHAELDIKIGDVRLPANEIDNPHAAIRLISPTLFTIIAFNAALFACNLVNQKLIKR